MCSAQPSLPACGTHLQVSLRLATAVLVRGCQILPEKAVVQVAATVEVEERRNASGLGHVALGLGIADALERAVEAVHVGLVVLGVVELHDLARDVRLERAVVVCTQGVSIGPSSLQQNKP